MSTTGDRTGSKAGSRRAGHDDGSRVRGCTAWRCRSVAGGVRLIVHECQARDQDDGERSLRTDDKKSLSNNKAAPSITSSKRRATAGLGAVLDRAYFGGKRA